MEKNLKEIGRMVSKTESVSFFRMINGERENGLKERE
jgi:hypothetical protein